MSLVSGLGAFITAVGADIKALQSGKRNKSGLWVYTFLCNYKPHSLSAGTWFNFNSNGAPSAGSSATPWTCIWYGDEIPAGTYDVEVSTWKINSAGILTFDFSTDGGSTWQTIASNVDLYNAAQAAWPITTTGFTVPASGRVDFRMRSLGSKNASSSAYNGYITGVTFRRTA